MSGTNCILYQDDLNCTITVTKRVQHKNINGLDKHKGSSDKEGPTSETLYCVVVNILSQYNST